MPKLAGRRSIALASVALVLTVFACSEPSHGADEPLSGEEQPMEPGDLVAWFDTGTPENQRLALDFYYAMLQSDDERQRSEARAMAGIMEARAVAPDMRAELQMHLAMAYRNSGEIAEREAVLDRLSAENPELTSIGGFSAEYERALEQLRKPDPDNVAAIEILESLLPYSEAVSDFQRGRLGVQLTNLYRSDGEFDKAIALAELTRNFIDEKDVNRLTLLSDLADSYFATENYDLAAMVYDEVAALAHKQNPNPTPAELVATLQVYAPLRAAAARDRAEARRLYSQAPEARPGSDGNKMQDLTQIALITETPTSKPTPKPDKVEGATPQALPPAIPQKAARSSSVWLLGGSATALIIAGVVARRLLRRRTLP